MLSSLKLKLGPSAYMWTEALLAIMERPLKKIRSNKGPRQESWRTPTFMFGHNHQHL